MAVWRLFRCADGLTWNVPTLKYKLLSLINFVECKMGPFPEQNYQHHLKYSNMIILGWGELVQGELLVIFHTISLPLFAYFAQRVCVFTFCICLSFPQKKETKNFCSALFTCFTVGNLYKMKGFLLWGFCVVGFNPTLSINPPSSRQALSLAHPILTLVMINNHLLQILANWGPVWSLVNDTRLKILYPPVRRAWITKAQDETRDTSCVIWIHKLHSFSFDGPRQRFHVSILNLSSIVGLILVWHLFFHVVNITIWEHYYPHQYLKHFISTACSKLETGLNQLCFFQMGTVIVPHQSVHATWFTDGKLCNC